MIQKTGALLAQVPHTIIKVNPFAVHQKMNDFKTQIVVCINLFFVPIIRSSFPHFVGFLSCVPSGFLTNPFPFFICEFVSSHPQADEAHIHHPRQSRGADERDRVEGGGRAVQNVVQQGVKRCTKTYGGSSDWIP